MDQKNIRKLAEQFMREAVKVGAGDHIWIEYQGAKAQTLAEACRDVVSNASAHPHLKDSSANFLNMFVPALSDDEISEYGQAQLAEMQQMDGYIRICDDADQSGITVSPEQMEKYYKALRPMTDERVRNTRWLVVSTPTEEFAKACGMGLEEFEDFYLDVCLLDYNRMAEAVKPLQKIMAEGKDVHIKGAETDLRFSIRGLDAIPCTGKLNIPDGECFTAPVKDSVNGTIKFGPSNYRGQRFGHIKLTFEEGKIIEATAENEERTTALNKILDTDEGARYIGEFAIAFNPYVLNPMGDILFDEKIAGSLHLAAGGCYDEADNGNKSAVHWDMVHIQRPEHGGGEIWIDDRLIRKDGLFVVPELEGLNPENLLEGGSNPAPDNAPRP